MSDSFITHVNSLGINKHTDAVFQDPLSNDIDDEISGVDLGTGAEIPGVDLGAEVEIPGLDFGNDNVVDEHGDDFNILAPNTTVFESEPPLLSQFSDINHQ